MIIKVIVKSLGLIMLGAAIMTSTTSWATPILTLYDGTNFISVGDNSGDDSNSDVGVTTRLNFDVGSVTNGTTSFEALADSSSMSMLGSFGSGAFSGSDTFLGTETEVQIVANITDTAPGMITSFNAEHQPIPEPATMLLLGTGLVGVAGAARRRKNNQA